MDDSPQDGYGAYNLPDAPDWREQQKQAREVRRKVAREAGVPEDDQGRVAEPFATIELTDDMPPLLGLTDEGLRFLELHVRDLREGGDSITRYRVPLEKV